MYPNRWLKTLFTGVALMVTGCTAPRSVIQRPEDVRPDVYELLVSMPAASSRWDFSVVVPQEVWYRRSRRIPELHPYLLQLLKDKRDHNNFYVGKTQILRALGDIPYKAEWTDEDILLVAMYLKNDNDYTRSLAVWVLGTTGRATAARILCNHLSTEGEATVRVNIALALNRSAWEIDVKPCLEGMQDTDPDEDAREKAAESLHYITMRKRQNFTCQGDIFFNHERDQ